MTTSADAEREAALSRLYRTERPGLLRLAVLLTGELQSAEDVVQDAFAALHRRWDELTDRDRAAGYLRVCVVNNSRTWHRRRRVARLYAAALEPVAVPGADAAMLLNEKHRRVVLAVRRLPRRRQQVVVLRYWSGLTEAEIADALGISIGTVKSTAARALAAMALMLGEDDET